MRGAAACGEQAADVGRGRTQNARVVPHARGEAGWEKLAARDPKFGNPAAFLSDVDRTSWYTFMVTITGDRTFHDYMEAKTGSKGSTGGMISVVDSNWKLNLLPLGKYHPDQPEDVPENNVTKAMQDCTGAEMFAEVLYHSGLKDKIDAILPHAVVHTAALPYIVSQFEPRKISDRPAVRPAGCRNLAFLGQFVEQTGDVVFTVETSVRTAMMAVWGFTGLDKPMVPLPEPIYDIRVLADNVKTMSGKELTPETLSALTNGSPAQAEIASLLSRIPQPAS